MPILVPFVQVRIRAGASETIPETAMATPSTLTSNPPPCPEWKDLLEEILPPQGRWSEEEYLTLTDQKPAGRVHRWLSGNSSPADGQAPDVAEICVCCLFSVLRNCTWW